MHLKKFLLFGLMAAVLPAVAEEAADRKTATSLKYVTHELETRQNKFSADNNKAMEYTNAAGTVQKRAVTSDLDNGGTESLPMVGGVNTKLNQKQDDIDPVNDHTAVTYTGTAGQIGQKGIYQTTESYAAQSDNLIDAKTFNAALKNGLDSEFVCREDNLDPVSGLCWLYTIHNKDVGNNLPSGYTALEYIESSGTQYIDTGVIVANAQTLQGSTIDFQVLTLESQNSSAIAGAVSTSGDGLYSNNQALVYNRSFYSGSGNSTPSGFDFSQSDTTKRTVATCNGRGIAEPGISFLLFARNRTELGPQIIGTQRIYSAQIYNNGTLVRNLIPARHGATVGMYDMASQQFFQSAASGTNFIAGPELNVYIPHDQ